MTEPAITTRGRFSPTPAWLIFGLLVVEGLLWLSERYQWFWFNEKKDWTVLSCAAVVGVMMLVMLGWFIASLILRWRFQFSIRSLLVLVVAVALPCSWMAVELKKARDQKNAIAAIRKSRGYEGYEYQLETDESTGFTNEVPHGPTQLRNLLGDDFFNDVWCVNIQKDADIVNLRGFPRLRSLSFSRDPVEGR